jgi:hypothetical protein
MKSLIFSVVLHGCQNSFLTFDDLFWIMQGVINIKPESHILPAAFKNCLDISSRSSRSNSAQTTRLVFIKLEMTEGLKIM